MRIEAVLSLGGNFPETPELFRKLPALLAEEGIDLCAISSILRSAPLDCPEGTPDFFNAAAVVQTALEPEALLDALQRIERKCGRPAEHGVHESRTLDLDILLYGKRRFVSERLTIPHPRALERDFVMRPLTELGERYVRQLRHLSAKTPS
ncbi:MAG: 2-amino-4-hydroxy-6-hydroxymethyldihydropteridine diphosphokinase [Victivallaceae bacterium]|nr:2-amino-4-hydroxy-6-hydroxymethyldihydropteridine diphosphokinase [Victivallaceae bacterium]